MFDLNLNSMSVQICINVSRNIQICFRKPHFFGLLLAWETYSVNMGYSHPMKVHCCLNITIGAILSYCNQCSFHHFGVQVECHTIQRSRIFGEILNFHDNKINVLLIDKVESFPSSNVSLWAEKFDYKGQKIQMKIIQ